jgi:hypothetical protein
MRLWLLVVALMQREHDDERASRTWLFVVAVPVVVAVGFAGACAV